MRGEIQLFLNGEPRAGVRSATVADLVLELDLPGPALLIEWNGKALHRSEWALAVLEDGDRLEFVRIVAGG
jgi:thiamine biosynthesis protein ThiS